MICSIAEFKKMWTAESEITARVLAALTDASLEQRVAPEDRTLGEIAWHLTTSIPEMGSHTGLSFEGPPHDAPVPDSASTIAETHKHVAWSLLDQVARDWSDATLQVKDEMYGEKWKRAFTLTVLIIHEIHHRGQVSVLMRQAGLRVPSIYGPNREETEAMAQAAGRPS
ncbi:MAG: DinB family protein [Acidobacteriota bacterium]